MSVGHVRRRRGLRACSESQETVGENGCDFAEAFFRGGRDIGRWHGHAPFGKRPQRPPLLRPARCPAVLSLLDTYPPEVRDDDWECEGDRVVNPERIVKQRIREFGRGFSGCGRHHDGRLRAPKTLSRTRENGPAAGKRGTPSWTTGKCKKARDSRPRPSA